MQEEEKGRDVGTLMLSELGEAAPKGWGRAEAPSPPFPPQSPLLKEGAGKPELGSRAPRWDPCSLWGFKFLFQPAAPGAVFLLTLPGQRGCAAPTSPCTGVLPAGTAHRLDPKNPSRATSNAASAGRKQAWDSGGFPTSSQAVAP